MPPPDYILEVARVAAEMAAEADRERRLPEPLVTAMADAGLFRLCVPKAVGGLEAHPAELAEAVEELARADGSAGWCAAICATSGLLAGYLPESAAREIHGPPGAITGGVFAPRGRAIPGAGGGFRVTGRWPFASGCLHCDWLMGGCVVEREGVVSRLPNGMPDVRLMLAPASAVTIHDTWDAMGLRGTGSHDIEMRDLHVPGENSASLLSDPPTHAGPLYAFPLFGLLALAIGAVGLGIGRGALDDAIAMAERTPTGSRRTVAERSTAQADLASAEARLRAARALLHEAIGDAWRRAAEDGEVPVEQRASLRLASTHAATTGAEVTGTAYRLGGAASVYEARSPLPRRFRDANVATQHMLVAPATLELLGRLLLSLDTDVTQL